MVVCCSLRFVSCMMYVDCALFVGRCLLAVGRWSLFFCCSLFVGCCWLVVVRWLLFVGYCFMVHFRVVCLFVCCLFVA